MKKKISLNDFFVCSTIGTITVVAVGLTSYIISCLCKVGDMVCVNFCNNRFIITNIVIGSGIILSLICGILVYITKTRPQKPRVK